MPAFFTRKILIGGLPPIVSALLLLVWPVILSQPKELRGLEAIQVPEGFTVEVAAGPELAPYATFGTLDEQGRLFLSESTGPNTMTTEKMLQEPSYFVRMLEDVDRDGHFDKSTIFADKMPFPNGSVFYRGSLYVSASPDLLRFEDTDGDGVADKREVVLTGWTLNVNGAILHGPFFGPDGWLYLTDARRGYKIQTKEGTVLEGKGPRIWRCRPDGSGLEWIVAGGFDNPVELIFTPAGEVIGTMTYFTDPKAGQRDALMHWVEGGVYPKPHSVIDEDKLKRTGDLMPVMTKFARVAPCGLARYHNTAFGPEYEGNLFSVQFNTHRILRHILTREGATFRTEDEDFLTSSDPDFHPTDVFEDADGSLLIIDTGGWFIKGCPVSRVTKPEFRGAIYRVKKKETPKVSDPRGRELRLETAAPRELIQRLDDSRSAVRDRTIELLVQAGTAAVGLLTDVLRNSSSPEIRCAAVFALFRIDAPDARKAVRSALEDRDLQVRIAAARSVGMAKDGEARRRLIAMLREDEPPARRQAATALAQIGDKEAAPALVAASADMNDRFVEHAVIYALIRLNNPPPLIQALNHASPSVRKAALIALDQMDGSPLRREHLVPFLAVEDQELRRTALWVASHHPEWSADVLQFLRGRLTGPEFTADEGGAVSDVLVSFCEEQRVQAMVAELIMDPAVSATRKLFLLDAVDRCRLQGFPKPWVDGIGQLLEGTELELRSRAVALVRSRRIKELSNSLERIANNSQENAELRTAALSALVISRPQPNESEFQFLLGRLDRRLEAPERILAAETLGGAKLTDKQLLTLARQYLPEADPLILNSMLNAFRGNSSLEVGEALVAGLSRSLEGLDSFQAKGLLKLFAGFPQSVQCAAEPLLKRLEEIREARIRRLQDLELELVGGDLGRGRRIFFGQKAACSSCHTIGDEGGEVGPDLTALGATRSRHDILESIIFPSASFVPGHETYRVETVQELYSGIVISRTPEAVLLVTGAESRIRIPRADITAMEPSSVSLMPEGLDEALTRTELADLMAFLEAQKGRLQQAERNDE